MVQGQKWVQNIAAVSHSKHVSLESHMKKQLSGFGLRVQLLLLLLASCHAQPCFPFFNTKAYIGSRGQLVWLGGKSLYWL